MGAAGCSVECWSAPPPPWEPDLTPSQPQCSTLLPYLQSSTNSLSSFSQWGSRAGSLGFLMDFRVSRLAFCPEGKKQQVSMGTHPGEVTGLTGPRCYQSGLGGLWGNRRMSVQSYQSHALARLGSPCTLSTIQQNKWQEGARIGQDCKGYRVLTWGFPSVGVKRSYLRWRYQVALLPKNVVTSLLSRCVRPFVI